MKRRYNEVFLAALILELSQVIYTQLEAAQTEADLKKATLEGYARAHLMGALWAGLGLLDVGLPRTKADFESALQTRAEESGVRLPKISSKPVLDRLETQVAIASQRLTETRDTNAQKRAAGYAARWGVQQGIDDMAAGSTATNADGQEVELLKTWVRLASRAEHRTWHDALEGVTIRYSQLFVIKSPNGTFRIMRPYDSSLPISEKIGCGHGIRVEPPRGADVQMWSGASAAIGDDLGIPENPEEAIKNLANAVGFFKKYNVDTVIDAEQARQSFPMLRDQEVIAFYNSDTKQVVLNPVSRYWSNQKMYMKRQGFWLSTDEPDHILWHELNHALQDRKNSRSYRGMPMSHNPLALDEIADKVSLYALDRPKEFLAEVWAAMQLGYEFDDLVLYWYKTYGGI
jgi:hypothetical protein